MKTNLQKNWWVFTINGLLAILFGALALLDSENVMQSIAIYFGLLILIGGILLLVGAYGKQRKKINYSLMITEGIISVVLGVLIMLFPEQAVRLFLIFIGVWALILGLFKIYIAIVLTNMVNFRYILLLGGIILIAIGLTVLLNPTYVAGFILQIVGAVFVILGMVLVYFSFVVKNAKNKDQ